jgi:hypothetical protein
MSKNKSKKLKDTFLDDQTIVRGQCQISWVDRNHGQNGVYDPANPEDIHLLDFDVSYFSDQGLIKIASVKSQTSFDQPKEILKELLIKLADRIADPVNQAQPSQANQQVEALKVPLDELQWIGPEWTFDW